MGTDMLYNAGMADSSKALSRGQELTDSQLWSVPPIIGTGIIIGIQPNSTNAAGLLIAFYCTQFFLAQGNMVISLISRNIAGQTKKSTCLTMTFVGKSYRSPKGSRM